MATSGSPTLDGEYVCTLSPEFIAKAEKELKEKPEWRKRDIQALRDMILNTQELGIPTDDPFLLRFLRARKFDYDRAFKLIMKHYQMKVENEDLFRNLRPSAVKHVLDAGITGVLPHRDRKGCRVIIIRPGLWEPDSFSLDDIFRTNFLILSKLIEEEDTQVNGVTILLDLNGIGWKQVKNISPLYAKRMITLLQDCFPMRFKAAHYLNEPKIFNYIFIILKPLLREKFVSRIHFHGNRMEELHKFIDPEYLPVDYGGKQPCYSNKDWAQKLLSCDAQFDMEAKYGLVSSQLLESHKRVKDSDLCVVGSYRKLDS
ncbi:hypothetical protein CHS0354_029513 [Potamilus streckersoni]|uniref:CRAL-TRIO domain-containing protein n=1 Tax=Potamilus streckersoni TaxID=2493646 RepID=A0AAE0T1I5_9BIVA|nr:hypothetical protein CHS0354_029513 [Potamilus streckersoni]